MTKLVGILNVTPDSFSDGGQFSNPASAMAQLEALIAAGADVVDIGAESTRPGAVLLDEAEEWERLAPVLDAARKFSAIISVDTRHAVTAARALEAGAHWINDVGGFADATMIEAVKASTCKLVVMHSLGVPPSADRVIEAGKDPVEVVGRWMQETLIRLQKQGIARERIILDPGIGFGKTALQSMELIRRIAELQAFAPLMIGHSRKSFLSLTTDKPAAARDEQTLALSESLAAVGVDYLRVHDVPAHRRMLDIAQDLR